MQQHTGSDTAAHHTQMVTYYILNNGMVACPHEHPEADGAKTGKETAKLPQ